MKPRIAISAGLTVLALALPCMARLSVAVMPFRNEAGDSLMRWVSYVAPEILTRQLQYLPGVQVWDPAFLYPVDSAGGSLDSDTLLKIHRARWGWDAIVGGSCRLKGDSLFMQLRVMHVRDGQTNRKAFVRGGISPVAVATDLLSDFLSYTGYAVSTQDSVRMRSVSWTEAAAYNTYAAGFGYEMRKDRTAAISAYEHAIAADPQMWPACIRIAGLYTLKRDITSARSYLDKAVAAQPRDPLVVAAMAGFLVEHTLPAVAEAYMDQKRDLLGQTAEGQLAMGSLAMAQGEYQRATAVLSRAVAAGPCNLDADFTLGRAYLMSGQFDLATDVFDRLIAYRSDYMRYYSFLGSTYRRSGRIMESIRVLETAYRINPDDIHIILNLAATYIELGWYEKAEQILKHGREINSTLSDIDINLGIVYWHMGRINEAKSLFQRAAKAPSPRELQAAYANEGNISFHSGDMSGAIRLYRKADKIGEKNETVLYNLGVACLQRKKYKEAVAAFEELLRLAPNRIDVLVKQADITAQLGDLKSAELYYRKILDLSPYNESAMKRLCEVLEKQGMGKESARVIEAYLKNFPNDKHFRLLLADTYFRLGWFEVSLMHYQGMTRDFPEYPPAYNGAAKAAFEVCVFKEGRGSDQVLFALKNAASKNPQDPEIDYMLGRIYADYKNDVPRAVEYWNSALRKAGRTPIAGKIRSAMGKAGKS